MPYQHTYTPPAAIDYQLLTPGWHEFEIVGCYDTDQEGKALFTSEGVPMLRFITKEQRTGQVVKYTLFLEAKNAPKLDAFLWAIGMGQEGAAVEWEPDSFFKKRFQGSVANHTANGSTFNKITRLKPVTETEPTRGEIAPEDQAPETAAEDKPELPF